MKRRTTRKKKPADKPAFGVTEPEREPAAAAAEPELGEPAGTGHAIDYSPADWIPIQCPECGSPNRKPFKGRTRCVITGERIHPNYGNRFDRVIFRPTECSDCGRRIMSREYRLGGDE